MQEEKQIEKKKKLVIEKSNILIVEGPNDQHFFEALSRHIQIDIQIIPIYGKDNLKNKLIAISKAPDFLSKIKAMGIIMDADDNPKGRFQSIKNALEKIKLTCPARPFNFSKVKGKPKVGVAILPDGNNPGELEDLCLDSVKNKNDFPFSCVEKYFKCLEENKIQIRKPTKSKIYAYLSTTEKPELRLGEAAKAGHFNFGHSAFIKVTNFLNSLVK